MDFLGYAALGGFERVAIVGGAILIGYWGYRIYGRDKTPGLVLLGLACVVLVSALVTGGGHVRSVSEGIQLASVPEPAAPSVELDAADTATIPQPPVEIPWADSQPASTAVDSSDVAALVESTAAEPAAEEVEEVAPDAEASVAQAQEAETDEEEDSLSLATGQELGGRIVSIKSANVSLEWSERE